MGIKRFIIFIFVILLSSKVYAEDFDINLFTEKNINIKAESSTLYEAKTNAIQQGLQQGLYALFYKFTPYNHHWKIKDLALDEAISYIEEFEIHNEVIEETSYKAKLDATYQPEQIKKLLESANIPYSLEEAPKTLVMLIINKDNNSYSWENLDIAWQNKTVNGPGLLRLNFGNFIGDKKINSKNAMTASYKEYLPLLNKYNSSEAVVILCTEDKAGYAVSIKTFMPDNTISKYIYYKKQDISAEGEDYKFIINDILQKLDAEWKGEDIFDKNLKLTSEVSFRFNNMSEWAAVQKSLQEISHIKHFKILNIKKNLVFIEITHDIDLELLEIYLNEKNLAIKQSTDGLILRRKA